MSMGEKTKLGPILQEARTVSDKTFFVPAVLKAFEEFWGT